MQQSTRCFGIILVITSIFIVACGSSGEGEAADEGTTGTDSSQAPNTSANNDEPSGQADSQPPRPEWDYTEWVWFSGDGGQYTIAAPPNSEGFNSSSLEQVSGGTKNEPTQIGQYGRVLIMEDITTEVQVYGLDRPIQSTQEFDSFAREFRIGMEVRFNLRDTERIEDIPYMGDYSRQYLFRPKYDYVGDNGDGDHYISIRLVIQSNHRYVLISSADASKYDQAQTNQMFDSIDVSQ